MSNKYLVESHGKLVLIDGKNWQTLEHKGVNNFVGTLSENVHLVTDFATTAAFKHIQCDYKYAEFILSKELKDSGEIVGNVQLLAIQKNKQAQMNNSVFYAPVNLETYNRYQVIADNTLHNTLLFSYYHLYASLAATNKSNQVRASFVVTESDISILLSQKGKVVGFESLPKVMFQGENRIASLTNALRTLERQLRLKSTSVSVHFWLEPDASVDWAEALASELQLDLEPVTATPVIVDGQPMFSSLAPHLGSLSLKHALNQSESKYLYLAKKSLPLVASLLLAANAYIGFQYFQVSESHQQLSARVQSMQSTLTEQIPSKVIQQNDYQLYLDDLERIQHASKLPGYHEVLADIATAIPQNSVVFDWISFDYPKQTDENKLFISLVGTQTAQSDDPIEHFNQFVKSLTSQGYKLRDSSVQTSFKGVSFALDLERPL